MSKKTHCTYLNQTNFIGYIGSDINCINILQNAASDSAVFEKMGSLDDLETVLQNTPLSAILIEESLVGDELSRIIKKYPMIIELPFIVVLKSSFKSARFKYFREKFGINHVIGIPFTNDEAQSFIHELIEYKPISVKETSPNILSQLFLQYRSTIPNELESIENLYNTAKSSPTTDTVEALRRLIHKLSGSSGTYGYAKAGIACRETEILLSKALESNDYGSELFKELEKTLQKIFFYFNTTFYKDPTATNLHLEPLTTSIGFVVSNDVYSLEVFKRSANELRYTLEFEIESEKVLDQLNSLDPKPETIIVDEIQNTTDGLALIGKIKSNVLASSMKFGLLVEEGSIESNKVTSIEGIDFIIKKPLSLKNVGIFLETLFIRKTTHQYKILIVNRDSALCHLIEGWLHDIGVSVKILSDKTKILEDLTEYHPNMLLLDIFIPNYDSWELINTLRSDIHFKDLKVIIITSVSDIDKLKESHQGFDDIWGMPLYKSQIQHKILKFAEANGLTL